MPDDPIPEFQQKIAEYRTLLQEMEQEMQSSYDKAVMTLSGGALGVSIAFVKDFLGKTNPSQPIQNGFQLFTAWTCWGISITAILISLFVSACAMRKAIEQTDNRVLYYEKLGGWQDRLTRVLNPVAGLLFMTGVVFIGLFAKNNLH